MTLHIKKDDTVKILSGKEKGKTGKVLKVLPKNGKVVVEGMHIHIRFSRPKRRGEKGQRMEIPSAINVSKVMLVCPHCGKPTRVAHEVTGNDRFRKCKNCNKVIA